MQSRAQPSQGDTPAPRQTEGRVLRAHLEQTEQKKEDKVPTSGAFATSLPPKDSTTELPASPVALEAMVAQSPMDLWRLQLKELHQGRAAATLGDTGSSPQPAPASAGHRNLPKLQVVGGLCGSTFCQLDLPPRAASVTFPSRHCSNPRKNSPFLLQAQQIERSRGKSKCLQDFCFTSRTTPLPRRDDSVLLAG